ncbi:hypothetical protein [Deinococcus radiotolerans]|uniref:Nucleotidyltransferase n=1 Tax=Deinococcus radiotolerans TaxID=1309407 RepID=A0ABQ2FQ09_9DEIO|nr:hypothetical protein [Deinococcus radiotolerans]GGL15451.1 hypothetical protein GCM10010844_37880 [Deinococcus radiotolerans]
MRAIQQPCEVTHVTPRGTPKVIRWNDRTYHLTQELDRYRAGGRWWLGEPSRTCWVLQCGSVVLEVHHFDETPGAHPQGWFIARMQD